MIKNIVEFNRNDADLLESFEDKKGNKFEVFVSKDDSTAFLVENNKVVKSFEKSEDSLMELVLEIFSRI